MNSSRSPLAWALCVPALLVLVLLTGVSPASAEDLSDAKISIVRYELSKVQQKVRDADGTAFELSKYDKKAFRLVMELAEKYPNDARVKKLVEEAKALYRAAKGVNFEITPEMLAYRDRAKKLAAAVARAGNDRWVELKLAARTSDDFIEKVFPVRMPPEADSADYEGKTVIFNDVPYEQDLFVQSGRNWITVGKPTTGFYFVEASGMKFDQLFEALRRYRNQIQQNVDPKWTIVGKVTRPDMLIPGGGKKKAGTPRLGWIVEPSAIYINNTVLVELDEDSADGAAFAGEKKLKELIEYSVTSVPDDVTPEQLVRIYITALKEKNFDLHLECIDPEQRQVGPQIMEFRYKWEVQQKGLERSHAHAEPVEVGEIRTVAGAVEEDLESFFGDEKKAPEKPRYTEDRVKITVRLFDEHGAQTVRARYVTLIRRNGGRWYIYSGATLTF